MILLVSPPPPSTQHNIARNVIQKIYALSEPRRMTTRTEREELARGEVDSFLSREAACLPHPLGQAAVLLQTALGIRTPPRFGNVLLTSTIDRCLLERVASFRTLHEAVQDHWGAWGSIAGVITALGGQPLLEQRLLAIGLSEHLNDQEIFPFAAWFAHPIHLGILKNLTSPVEFFLAFLHDAASFLADPEIFEELCGGENSEHTARECAFEISLEQGELWARAMGLHQHLSLPDLSFEELESVQSFYRASGFSSALEDVVRQTWTSEVPDDAVGLGINMLGYAQAYWVLEALQTQPLEEVENFTKHMSEVPIAAWSKVISTISKEVERHRHTSRAL